MAYLLDANVFIKAKNDEYGFDLCPGFWDWLDLENAKGDVFSVDHVRSELLAHDDELAAWARGHGEEFFLPPDQAVLDKVAALSEWAITANYTSAAKNAFVEGGADIFLVAHSMAYAQTVVTLEVADSKKNRIKIPEAAIPHRVRCIRPYVMLRTERARFVLDDERRSLAPA